METVWGWRGFRVMLGGNMVWNLPNILTVIRLLAAPMVALVFVLLPRPFADWAALTLFFGAAVTDFLDGQLARAWSQESRFGAMADPIADKAIVVISLAVICALWGLQAAVIIPAAVILFREVFVSGLREFLGEAAGTLQVTKLAKWKTTVQMLAITVLLSRGGFEHLLIERTIGMGPEMATRVLAGIESDEVGLRGLQWWAETTNFVGLLLLWIAAVLTAMTGWDYFRKAAPHLRD